MRTLARIAVALLTVVVLAGCTAPRKVRADHDPGFEFGGWATWRFAPVRKDAEGRVNDAFHNAVRETVAESLTSRGFALAASRPPEFLVVYHGQLSRRIGFSGYLDLHASSPWLNEYARQPGWRLKRSLVRRYKHATVLIDLVDFDTGYVVWRGFATSDNEDPPPPEDVERLLREEVAEILALFPPQPD